jgi:hypothetical protein
MTIYNVTTVRDAAHFGVFLVNAANATRGDRKQLDVTVHFGIVKHVSCCELPPDVMEKLRALDKVVLKEKDQPVWSVLWTMDKIVELLEGCGRTFFFEGWHYDDEVDSGTGFKETHMTLVWGS